MTVPLPKTDQTDPTARLAAEFRSSLPLRLELDAVSRLLGTLGIETATCLDLGFASPLASRGLRRVGGYWSTAVRTAAEQQTASRVLGEEVLRTGPRGELPFEDKQFDLVVLGHGLLGASRAADEALVQECHRVLKTTGYLVLSTGYRKTTGLATLLRRSPDGRAGYSDNQLFELLKSGFDVLGIRTYCRFWVQSVSQWLDRRGGGRVLVGLLYRLALQLDLTLFFTKGYRVLAYGRRKGWRPRQTPVLSDGRSLPEAVLRAGR